MEERRRNKCWWCCFCCQTNEDSIIISENTETTEVPTIPKSNATFSGPLPQPLLTGHLVTVTGNILPQCASYSVNFKCGKESQPDRDTALHFNPRVEQNYVVRNSYLNGKWGNEETTSLYRLHMQKNTKFRIEVFIAPTQFLISLDGKHFCSYKYRVLVHKISSLEIHGDVEVTSVSTTEATQYPMNIILPTVGFAQLEDNNHFEVPWTGRLVENLQPGWQLEIEGRVKILPQGFYINLQDGEQIWPHPNVPLHLNPRFVAGNHLVVRNYWLNSAWGYEERANSQFSPGHNFHLIIRMESDEFSVWVNGKMTGLFKSKDRNIDINTIHIEGDVVINSVWVNINVKNIFIHMEESKKTKHKV